jgi:flavorubredoxin
MLVETGHPKDFPLVAAQLSALLAEGCPPLKYLFLTHEETPHAGGLGRILRQYPNVTVHGDVSDYHLAFPQFAENLRPMQENDTIDLGNRVFLAVEPVIRDLRSTLWGFDTRERVLFPADGFAYSHYHGAGHCGKLAEEADDLDISEGAAVFAERALFWSKFSDMVPYINRLRRLVERLDVAFVAPTHGLPIGNLNLTMPKIERGLIFGGEANDGPGL